MSRLGWLCLFMKRLPLFWLLFFVLMSLLLDFALLPLPDFDAFFKSFFSLPLDSESPLLDLAKLGNTIKVYARGTCNTKIVKQTGISVLSILMTNEVVG